MTSSQQIADDARRAVRKLKRQEITAEQARARLLAAGVIEVVQKSKEHPNGVRLHRRLRG